MGVSSGPERVLAMPEEMPAYRRAKARSLAGQIRELLNRARDIGGMDGPVWATLRSEDLLVVMTIMCWSQDALATVWVREEEQRFQDWGETVPPASQDFYECRKLANKVRAAVGELDEGLRVQMEETLRGWSAKGLQFTSFEGPEEAMDVLKLEVRQVRKVKVLPTQECSRKVCAGVGKVPLIVDEQHSFVAFLGENLLEHAEFEIIRVIDAAVRTGAAGGPVERWCLLCSEHLLYLVSRALVKSGPT